MCLELIEFSGTIEEFMMTDEFKEKIDKPFQKYYDQVYAICTSELSDLQKKMFDDWWYSRERIPSDACYWDNTEVPEGYEEYTPLDIKTVHDNVLAACSMGCG